MKLGVSAQLSFLLCYSPALSSLGGGREQAGMEPPVAKLASDLIGSQG